MDTMNSIQSKAYNDAMVKICKLNMTNYCH